MAKQHLLDTILDEQEQTYIREFYENEKMREAVRKVLLAGLYYQGTLRKGKPSYPLINSALSLVSVAFQGGSKLSNEDLGADLRALYAGINALEGAFSNMARYRTDDNERSPKDNPAK